MIKPEELRIGNLLDRNGVMEITGLRDNGKLFFYDHYNKVRQKYGLCSSSFKGIPLSPEWLIKGGFEATGVVDSTFKIKVWDRGALWICFLNGKVRFEIGNTSEHIVSIRQQIEHLHQLQNLYYALTGSELTFKDL